ncbi:MAG TPA: hypothetical protein VN841_28515 [Bryobacteraceae bacterium]|nr:hypothetical protein [Bryobacteraceae bacterium]
MRGAGLAVRHNEGPWLWISTIADLFSGKKPEIFGLILQPSGGPKEAEGGEQNELPF